MSTSSVTGSSSNGQRSYVDAVAAASAVTASTAFVGSVSGGGSNSASIGRTAAAATHSTTHAGSSHRRPAAPVATTTTVTTTTPTTTVMNAAPTATTTTSGRSQRSRQQTQRPQPSAVSQEEEEAGYDSQARKEDEDVDGDITSDSPPSDDDEEEESRRRRHRRRRRTPTPPSAVTTADDDGRSTATATAIAAAAAASIPSPAPASSSAAAAPGVDSNQPVLHGKGKEKKERERGRPTRRERRRARKQSYEQEMREKRKRDRHDHDEHAHHSHSHSQNEPHARHHDGQHTHSHGSGKRQHRQSVTDPVDASPYVTTNIQPPNPLPSMTLSSERALAADASSHDHHAHAAPPSMTSSSSSSSGHTAASKQQVEMPRSLIVSVSEVSSHSSHAHTHSLHHFAKHGHGSNHERTVRRRRDVAPVSDTVDQSAMQQLAAASQPLPATGRVTMWRYPTAPTSSNSSSSSAPPTHTVSSSSSSSQQQQMGVGATQSTSTPPVTFQPPILPPFMLSFNASAHAVHKRGGSRSRSPSAPMNSQPAVQRYWFRGKSNGITSYGPPADYDPVHYDRMSTSRFIWIDKNDRNRAYLSQPANYVADPDQWEVLTEEEMQFPQDVPGQKQAVSVEERLKVKQVLEKTFKWKAEKEAAVKLRDSLSFFYAGGSSYDDEIDYFPLVVDGRPSKMAHAQRMHAIRAWVQTTNKMGQYAVELNSYSWAHHNNPLFGLIWELVTAEMENNPADREKIISLKQQLGFLSPPPLPSIAPSIAPTIQFNAASCQSAAAYRTEPPSQLALSAAAYQQQQQTLLAAAQQQQQQTLTTTSVEPTTRKPRTVITKDDMRAGGEKSSKSKSKRSDNAMNEDNNDTHHSHSTSHHNHDDDNDDSSHSHSHSHSNKHTHDSSPSHDDDDEDDEEYEMSRHSKKGKNKNKSSNSKNVAAAIHWSQCHDFEQHRVYIEGSSSYSGHDAQARIRFDRDRFLVFGRLTLPSAATFTHFPNRPTAYTLAEVDAVRDARYAYLNRSTNNGPRTAGRVWVPLVNNTNGIEPPPANLIKKMKAHCPVHSGDMYIHGDAHLPIITVLIGKTKKKTVVRLCNLCGLPTLTHRVSTCCTKTQDQCTPSPYMCGDDKPHCIDCGVRIATHTASDSVLPTATVPVTVNDSGSGGSNDSSSSSSSSSCSGSSSNNATVTDNSSSCSSSCSSGTQLPALPVLSCTAAAVTNTVNELHAAIYDDAETAVDNNIAGIVGSASTAINKNVIHCILSHGVLTSGYHQVVSGNSDTSDHHTGTHHTLIHTGGQLVDEGVMPPQIEMMCQSGQPPSGNYVNRHRGSSRSRSPANRHSSASHGSRSSHSSALSSNYQIPNASSVVSSVPGAHAPHSHSSSSGSSGRSSVSRSRSHRRSPSISPSDSGSDDSDDGYDSDDSDSDSRSRSVSPAAAPIQPPSQPVVPVGPPNPSPPSSHYSSSSGLSSGSSAPSSSSYRSSGSSSASSVAAAPAPQQQPQQQLPAITSAVKPAYCTLTLDQLLGIHTPSALCFNCGGLTQSHPLRQLQAAAAGAAPATANAAATDAANWAARYKMPVQTAFPEYSKFKTRILGVIHDPTLYFEAFNRVVENHSVPESRILGAFINALSESTHIEYVEKELKPKNLSWAQVQAAFIKRFTDKALPDKLKHAYENCKQQSDQTVAQFTSNFQELVRRLAYDPTSATVVDAMERGFKQSIIDKLKARRVINTQLYEAMKPADSSAPLNAAQQQLLDKSRPFTSLTKLSECAVECEAEIASASNPYRDSRTGARSRKTASRKHSSKRRGGTPKGSAAKAESQSNNNDSSAAASSPATGSGEKASKKKAKNNRLGMTEDGPAHSGGKKPAKGSGKKKGGKSKYTANQSKDKSTMVCFNCNKPGHSQVECRKNLEKCKLCKEPGHMFVDCPRYRAPRAKALSASLFQSESVSAISVTSTRLGSKPLINILLDSGAEFSAISKRVVERYNLTITPVPTHEDQGVAGVDRSMKVKRIGTVILPVTVSYPLGAHDASVSFTKKFEVVDIDEDMLLGVEVWMTLFPNFEGERCLCKMASITTPPTQIKYHKAAHIYRVVATEPASSSGSATSASKGEAEADIYDTVVEANLYEIGSVDLDVQEVSRIFAMHSLAVDLTVAASSPSSSLPSAATTSATSVPASQD